jgi:Rrf2 family protein
MMLSRTGEYALRAVLHLAQHVDEGPTRADDIAQSLSVPRNYLSKILHELGRAGVLTSSRGPRGGFVLARPSEELTLEDIVGHFDPLDDRRRCVLGREGGCNDDAPCAAHVRWSELSQSVVSFFRKTTVAQLLVHPAGAEAVMSEE